MQKNQLSWSSLRVVCALCTSVCLLFSVATTSLAGPSLRMLSPGEEFATGDRMVRLAIGYDELYDVFDPHYDDGTQAFFRTWDTFGSTGSTSGLAGGMFQAYCYSPPPDPIAPDNLHKHWARAESTYGVTIDPRNISNPWKPENKGVHDPFNRVSIGALGNLFLRVHYNAWDEYRAMKWGGTYGVDPIPNVYTHATANGYTSNSDPEDGDYWYFQVGSDGPASVSSAYSLMIEGSTSQYIFNNKSDNISLSGGATANVTHNGHMVPLGGGTNVIHVEEGDIIGVKLHATGSMGYNSIMNPAQEYKPGVADRQGFVLLGGMWNAASVSLTFATGLSPDTPLIPDTPKENNVPFSFDDLNIGPDSGGLNEPVWFDPDPVDTFEFLITGNTVSSLMSFDLGDPDGVVIRYFDGTEWHSERAYPQWGQFYYMFDTPVSWFFIEDIADTDLSDVDMMAFGLVFTDEAITSVSITPIPEPATLGLLVIGGLALLRRRRTD